MASTEERCTRCGGMLGKPASGSITQWIAVCNCASLLAPRSDDAPVEEAIKVCAKCGKRIKTGRAGSLTQWVFRQDLCGCAEPEPVEADPERAFPNLMKGLADVEEQSTLVNIFYTAGPDQETDQQPLEVDALKFPTERYTPIKEIGKGGSGTVYYCRDRLLQKVVAVKVLHALNQVQLLSFQNEARATSKLNHPNVVQVMDFGATASGVPFMAMEYVDGVSLQRYTLEGKFFSINEVVEIFLQVCAGLFHAHKAEILHRDMKSSNVLISAENNKLSVRIIDFGVAVLKAEKLDQGQQGMTLVGTPSYMPPDQARGETYDERSEVYELGCTLFEALTGDTPFKGDTVLDLMRKHAHESPPSLQERRPEVDFPEKLEAIVAKCLAKQKLDRYQSVSELAEALEELRPAVPYIVEEPSRVLTATNVSYALATVAVVSGVVLAINLGAGILFGSEKLTEEKMPAVPEPSIYGAVLVEAAYETERPRFFERNKPGGDIWITAKGAVTNDSLVELSKRKDIKRLSLIGDTVDGKGLVFLLGNPIEVLNLNNTQVKDADIDVLSRFPKLAHLSVWDSKITARGLADMNKLPVLSWLEFGGKLIDSADIAAVTSVPQLTGIEIRGTRVKPADLEKLAVMPRLNELSFRTIQVDAGLIKAIEKLKRLQSLRLIDCAIEDGSFLQIKKLSIKTLKVHRCRLSDKELAPVGDMKDLKELGLSGTYGFSKEALKQVFKKLPRLQTIE